ncbi:hypothetical protein PENTCL1PPCAC_30211, partial [Pristionchus entomophagus]
YVSACSIITIQAKGNCPAKGYDCDDTLPIRYRVRDDDNWANAEVECIDEQACLADDYQIVDKARCRDSKWRAEGKCDIPTTSVVCAKRCDSDVCASHLHDAPSEYKKLSVHDATESSKCAVAKCKCTLHSKLAWQMKNSSLHSSCSLTGSGNGKWAVNDKEKHTYVMCNREKIKIFKKVRVKIFIFCILEVYAHICNSGCDYSCPAGQVLTRLLGDYVRTAISAKCTDDGILIGNGRHVERVGCSSCDVADGRIDLPDGD